MLKALVRDGAIYGLLRVLTSGINLILLPLYTRMLKPAEFGLYEAVTVIGVVATALIILEIPQGLARHYASGATADERARYASTAFWFTAAVLGATVAVLWPLARPIADVSAGREYAGALRVAFFAVATQALLHVALMAMRYGGHAWRYAAVSVIYSATAVVAAFAFVLGLRWGLTGVLAAQLTAAVVGIAAAWIVAQGQIRFAFDRRKFRQMLLFSLPLVASTLGVYAATYADRLMVGSMLSLGALGVYGLGARVASVVAIVATAFHMALSPLIYKHYLEPESPETIERLFRWFVAGCTLPLLLAGAFAKEIIDLTATSAYDAAAGVIFLLGLATLASNLYLFAPGLAIANRTGAIAAVNVAVAVCSVGLNAYVVPIFGTIGAAAVTCVVAAAGFAVQVVLGQVSYPIPFRWGRMAAAAVVLTGFAVASTSFSLIDAPILVRAAAFLAAGGLVVAVLIVPGELRKVRAAIVRQDTPAPREVCDGEGGLDAAK